MNITIKLTDQTTDAVVTFEHEGKSETVTMTREELMKHMNGSNND